MNENRFKIMADDSCIPGAVRERDGIHFGLYAQGKGTPELILYRAGSNQPEAVLPFPEPCGPGRFYSMKVKASSSEYEYNYRVDGEIFTDPYARKLVGREEFGKLPTGDPNDVRGGFPTRAFRWEDDRRPQLAYEDAVMYQLHVRGFTRDKNSGVRKKGTFAGLTQKLPYLKDLGINQLRLMPVYEFEDRFLKNDKSRCIGKPALQQEAARRFAEKPQDVPDYGLNFWGYGKGWYFAPKAAYAASENPDIEFKTLVKSAHALGIEVIPEFHFSDEIPVGEILDCFRYWAAEYHVDGFAYIGRQDLAQELAKIPVFRDLKLICDWYPEHVLQENAGRETSFLLAESNDGFMNTCRRFLKGDEEMMRAFADCQRHNPQGCAAVNYVTHHDGFTLEDLVSYDRKHNLENGEFERDGTDYNYSWNCGEEGHTRKKEIQRIRTRQKKNALAMLLFAQGTPMLLAGDEFGNSQNGNNNPYCHDSEITWIGWNKNKINAQLTAFVRQAIQYRMDHRTLRQPRQLLGTDSRSGGYPDLSYHGDRAWYCEFDRLDRHLGVLYDGSYAGEEQLIYIAYNMYWSEQEFALPLLKKQMEWYKVMDTSLEESFPKQAAGLGLIKSFRVPPRTIMILEGRKHDAAAEKNN